jgi:hypothetical protein
MDKLSLVKQRKVDWYKSIEIYNNFLFHGIKTALPTAPIKGVYFKQPTLIDDDYCKYSDGLIVIHYSVPDVRYDIVFDSGLPFWFPGKKSLEKSLCRVNTSEADFPIRSGSCSIVVFSPSLDGVIEDIITELNDKSGLDYKISYDLKF